jgi:hypothetical protein|tara:strand:- start:3906 stop:4304 length:399 start_codon:yes stop_codon:yes gene_type:complete
MYSSIGGVMATEADNIMMEFRAGNLAAQVNEENREAMKTGVPALFDDITGGILGATTALNFGGIMQEATDTRTFKERVEGQKVDMQKYINVDQVVDEISNTFLQGWKRPDAITGLTEDQKNILGIIEDGNSY